MSCLIKVEMAELRAHKIFIENNSTVLVIDEEKYKLRFREKHTRQDIPDERWATTELVPNDKLSIKFDDLYDKEWNKAEELKKFISKIENSNDLNQKTKDWLEWAKFQILELDPLSNGIDSFIAQFDLPESLKEEIN